MSGREGVEVRQWPVWQEQNQHKDQWSWDSEDVGSHAQEAGSARPGTSQAPSFGLRVDGI